MRVVGGIAVFTSLLLAGCGGRNDDGGLLGPSPLDSDPTIDEVAGVLRDAGFGCVDIAEKPAAEEEPSMTFLPPPEVTEGLCTAADGTPLAINVFADADQVEIAEAQLEVFGEMAKAFGMLESAWVEAGPSDRVWIYIETGDDAPPRPTDAERGLLARIAGAVGGDVRTKEF